MERGHPNYNKIVKIFLWARGNPTNRIPESADKNKDKLPEKISEEKSEEPSEKTEKTEKTDFEMLEKSESLFDQVKESMPEEEWLVLYMKGRVSRTNVKYGHSKKNDPCRIRAK